MDVTYVGIEISKAEKQQDGSVIVWGPCTTDDVDSDRQIIDPDFAAKGLTKWLATGANVREMHQPRAIGKGVELVREGNVHFLKTRVVDSNAVNLVMEKVLSSYSVGIANARLDRTTVKAPNGRIVGGDFVEVSLVDRPANAACKVDLVEKAADGSALFTTVITHKDGMPEGHVKCPTCKGDGKIMGGNRNCPDCGASGHMTGDTIGSDGKVKKLCGEPGCGVCTGSITKAELDAASRDAVPDKHFAYIDSQGGRHLPIHDAGHVQSALGRFGQTKFEDDASKKAAAKKIVSRASELGIDVDAKSEVGQLAKVVKGKGKIPKDDKDVTDALDAADKDVANAKDSQAKDNANHMAGTDDDATKGGPAPYVLKRLHDATCACYSTQVVLDAHTSMKSLSDAIDVDYWKTEMEKALSIGPDAAGPVLSAYQAVTRLAACSDADLDEARSALHKMFTEAYPTVHLTPSAVAPGQFKRPFLSAGRAGMRASGKPKMPAGAKPISAPNFGGMTKAESVEIDGQTLVKVSLEGSDGGFIATTEKAAYKALRTAVAATGVELPSWKSRSFYTNAARDQATSTMQAVHDYIVSAHPGICSMKAGPDTDADDVEPANDHPATMPNNAAGKPMPASGAGIGKAILTGTATGLSGNDITKAYTKVTDRLTKAEKKQRKTEKRLNKAQARIDELEKMPDPGDDTYRGARVLPFLPKTQTPTEDPAEQDKVEKAQTVEWCKKEIAFGDSESRTRAITKLQNTLEPDELAEALTTLPIASTN